MALGGIPDKGKQRVDTSKCNLQPQGEHLVDEIRKGQEQAKSYAKNMILSMALADGKVSDYELTVLAKIDFTVNDVNKILNNSNGDIANLNLTEEDKQKLTDDLMTRLETYRSMREQLDGQDSQFGV